MREGDAPINLLWVGSEGGMEQALVERAGIPFRGISTGQLRGANPFKLARNAARMAAGTRQSLALIDSFRPDACFVTGGYVCGPVVAACALRKVPVLIYLPDMTPGYAIRLLSKMAQRVAVTLPEAAAHFGGEAPAGKAVVTGYPVRDELLAAKLAPTVVELLTNGSKLRAMRDAMRQLARPQAAQAIAAEIARLARR